MVGAPILIALGSNIDAARNLPRAVSLLCERVTVVQTAHVYRSSPIGYLEQADFYNSAVRIQTDLSPQQLKHDVLRDIETQLHRVRDPRNKNGPRTIDLDIVCYGTLALDEDGLLLPDPEILLRPFLAIPLAELSPEFQHPHWPGTLRDLAATMQTGDLTRCREIQLLPEAT